MYIVDKFWQTIEKKDIKRRKRVVEEYSLEIIRAIYDFCITTQILRTPENCERELNRKGIKVTSEQCANVIQYLFDERKMGAYIFGEGVNPQSYMQKKIIEKFPNINTNSFILEVGPGDLPIFNESDYHNWYGCDLNFDNGVINFSEQIWGKDKYKKIYTGAWENLVETVNNNLPEIKFDLVCGSHSFEHNRRPIRAIKEAAAILKDDGILAIFVPDGYSTWYGNYDRTHSMYLTSEMVYDLFDASGCFIDVECCQFRPNMDLFITARKK